MSESIDVQVICNVQVELNKKKFNKKFMKEFRETFYNFQDIYDHAKHLAQLFVRGIIDENTDFIESYGDPAKMGIKIKRTDLETEII